MSNVDNNKRIAKNTILLYIRMLFLMLINLYTSRIVLQNLGIENYGIYNAVGGFISMFSMISASLSTVISRYLTYAIGKYNLSILKRVFSTSIIIQIIICSIIVLLIEFGGTWFLNTEMVIPEGRILAANWVLQFSLLTFVVNLLSVPYNAILIAHERMKAFAYIGIYEGIAALCIAYLLIQSPIDTLIWYSLLMFLVALSTRLIYSRYCKKHFEECDFKWILDGGLLKEMLGFAGWNFIGVSSGVLRSQGINILFNIYFGPTVNAARGLAVQVLNAVNKFSGSFYTAVQPQITKYYANGDSNSANILVCKSSRFSFFLLLVICVPIIFEAEFLLSVWLKDVPDFTVGLTRVVLIFTMVESFSQPLVYLMLATGKIKKYQIIVGTICLLNFPFAWTFLHLGYSVILVQSTTILFSSIALFSRLYLLQQMVNFPVSLFIKEVLIRSILVLLLSFVIPSLLVFTIGIGWSRFIIDVLLTSCFSLIMIFLFGLNKSERSQIVIKIKSKIKFKNNVSEEV